MRARIHGAIRRYRKGAGIGNVVISSPSRRGVRDEENDGFIPDPLVQYEKGLFPCRSVQIMERSPLANFVPKPAETFPVKFLGLKRNRGEVR